MFSRVERKSTNVNKSSFGLRRRKEKRKTDKSAENQLFRLETKKRKKNSSQVNIYFVY